MRTWIGGVMNATLNVNQLHAIAHPWKLNLVGKCSNPHVLLCLIYRKQINRYKSIYLYHQIFVKYEPPHPLQSSNEPWSLLPSKDPTSWTMSQPWSCTRKDAKVFVLPLDSTSLTSVKSLWTHPPIILLACSIQRPWLAWSHCKRTLRLYCSSLKTGQIIQLDPT